jgi:hypothetical protein
VCVRARELRCVTIVQAMRHAMLSDDRALKAEISHRLGILCVRDLADATFV